MRKKDQFTYSVILQFINRKLKRKEAAELLQVRERTISRMARRIEGKSMAGSVHGNRGKDPWNLVDKELKKTVMQLMKEKYFDFNMTHALEKLNFEHGLELSYTTFRRWCSEANLVKRKKRRAGKVRNARVRMPNEGLLLQFDGSPHRYNGKDEWCLLLAIDDATSKVPCGEFFLSEDTLSCMTVIEKIVCTEGIPEALYVDKAGWSGGQKRTKFSQFKRACEEIGIHVIFANSAQAKGRVERSFDTIQDRICPELRLRNIKSIPAANYYLQNQFLPDYWNKTLTVVPRSTERRYKPCHKTKEELREIFCIKEYRSVKSDHTISWDGRVYKVISPLKFNIWKQKIEFRTYQDLSWRAFFADKPIELEEFLTPQKLQTAA